MKKNTKQNCVSAVIAAAGNSVRMGGVNKQLLMLDGIPALARTLISFSEIPDITEIIVTVRNEDLLIISDMIKDFGIEKVKAIIPGGATRQESIRIALNHVTEPLVLIHDGARPMVSHEIIRNVIDCLETCDAAAPGVKTKDTIKKVDSSGIITETLERDGLVQIQTPQGFRTDIIRSAHQSAAENSISVTDDCALAEIMGIAVHIVNGEYQNIKITTPEDVNICEALLSDGQTRR